jgi:ssRNA-specific RNase YbeY (16S rRNA maturation enzyme)
VNNKTDKYILNILEHNNLQNTMFTLVYILIQEQHDINLLYLPNDSVHDVMKFLYLQGYVAEYQVTICLKNI